VVNSALFQTKGLNFVVNKPYLPRNSLFTCKVDPSVVCQAA
jgi:hypothetical protein